MEVKDALGPPVSFIWAELPEEASWWSGGDVMVLRRTRPPAAARNGVNAITQ